MADFIFNIAKGKIAEKVADGATLRVLILKGAGTDAAMKDADNITALLAVGSVVEADFTNYPTGPRQAISGATATVDDTADLMKVDCSDILFTSAGGASNNTTTDAIIYEDVDGSDGDNNTAIPLMCFDAVFTTDGNNVTLQINASGLMTAS
jgi:hypothetical protein